VVEVDTQTEVVRAAVERETSEARTHRKAGAIVLDGDVLALVGIKALEL